MQGHLEINDDIHCHYDHFQDRGQDLSIHDRGRHMPVCSRWLALGNVHTIVSLSTAM